MHKEAIIIINEGKTPSSFTHTGKSKNVKNKLYNKRANFYAFLSRNAYNLLGFTKICINIKQGKIFIKRAGIDDNDVRDLTNTYTIGLSVKYFDYLGTYYIEKDEEFQDEFELIKIEE